MAVVGAGPAGLAAACRAAEAGARVLLLDEQPAPGGQIWRRRRCRAPIRPALAAAPGAQRRRAAGGRQRLRRAAGPAGGRVAWRAAHAAGSSDRGGHRRARAVPAFPGLDAAGRVRRRRGPGPAQAGRLVRGAARGGLGQRAAAAGGRRAAGACGRPRGDDRRASADGPPGGLRRRSLAPAGQAGRGAARARGGLARHLPPEHVGHGRSRRRAGRIGHAQRRLARVARGLRPVVLRLRPGPEPRAGAPAGLRDRTARSARGRAAAQQRAPRAGRRSKPTGIAGVEQALVTGQIAGLVAAGRAPEPGLPRAGARPGDASRRPLARAFELRPELRALPQPDTIVCRCEDVALGGAAPRVAPCAPSSSRRARGWAPARGACAGRPWPSCEARPPTTRDRRSCPCRSDCCWRRRRR